MSLLRRILEGIPRGAGRFGVAVLSVAWVGLPCTVRGQGLVEFTIPTANCYPLALTAGPDGALWFTESGVDKIGRITPDGIITEFALPTAYSFPDGIVAGPDGALWFSEQGGNRIGRITTAGVLTEFAIPTPYAGPSRIAAGPDGALWFTEVNENTIGRITADGTVTELAVPHHAYTIAAGPDGALWFGYLLPQSSPGLGQTAGGIARLTTSGVVTEFPISTVGIFPTGIASGPDGALWFSEYVGIGGKIGRITTAGVITEFPLPIPAVPGFYLPTGGPGGLAVGPDGALWFTELGGIGRITTAGVVSQFLVPNASSGPAAITAGSDGYIWFLEGPFTRGFAGIGKIAPAACPLSPTILCLNNSRLRIEAAWTSSDGKKRSGQARFLSQHAGYLWFSTPGNPELMVKTLDGCWLNNNYWIFAAGLTNLDIALRITDVLTGQVKTYVNPQGTAFQPIQDTNAFPCQ